VANATSADTAGTVVGAALGVLRVVEADMARALRVVSVERGIDPRGLSLAAFGGAGPLHACALAEELGMERVLVPLAEGKSAATVLIAGLLMNRRNSSSPLSKPSDWPAVTPESAAAYSHSIVAGGLLLTS